MLGKGRFNVLVACECSGAIRKVFRNCGHNAFSCDLKSDIDNSPYHIVDDAVKVLKRGCPTESNQFTKWDLVIAHPPCTRLCNSGVLRLYKDGKKINGIDPVKWAEMEEGAKFFKSFFTEYDGPLCVENPVMHGHGKQIIGELKGVVTQYIQPYQFGEDASKKTVLWLRDLCKLEIDPHARLPGRTVVINGKEYERWSNQTDSGQNKLGPSEERAAIRAVTYPKIAEAMYINWNTFLKTQDFIKYLNIL